MADETNRTPDETLRAAAVRLRRFAWSARRAQTLSSSPAPPTSSPCTPGVALALAEWLDSEADGETFAGLDGATHVPHPTLPEALDVARAVLRGA